MKMGKSTMKRDVCNNCPCVDAYVGDFEVSQVPLLGWVKKWWTMVK
jgi:hypothetical protein